jgi:hypothetical protein
MLAIVHEYVDRSKYGAYWGHDVIAFFAMLLDLKSENAQAFFQRYSGVKGIEPLSKEVLAHTETKPFSIKTMVLPGGRTIPLFTISEDASPVTYTTSVDADAYHALSMLLLMGPVKEGEPQEITKRDRAPYYELLLYKQLQMNAENHKNDELKETALNQRKLSLIKRDLLELSQQLNRLKTIGDPQSKDLSIEQKQLLSIFIPTDGKRDNMSKVRIKAKHEAAKKASVSEKDVKFFVSERGAVAAHAEMTHSDDIIFGDLVTRPDLLTTLSEFCENLLGYVTDNSKNDLSRMLVIFERDALWQALTKSISFFMSQPLNLKSQENIMQSVFSRISDKTEDESSILVHLNGAIEEQYHFKSSEHSACFL